MKKILAILLALLVASAWLGALAEALPQEQAELYGKPWVTTYDAGNLPDDRTHPADDLNIYVNYDVFDGNRNGEKMIQSAVMTADEPPKLLTKLIKEGKCEYPGFEQLRLFYEQAADIDTADALGIEPVRPYLDRIEGAASIGELNAVLTDADFPFLPFLTICLCSNDMRGTTGYALYPNFTSCSPFDPERLQDGAQGMAALTGMDNDMLISGALEKLEPGVTHDVLQRRMLDFEKSYGRYALSNESMTKLEYGEMDALYSFMTAAELDGRFKSFPVAGMLAKEGCDPAEILKIPCIEWMDALDGLWTEENLDLIKRIAEVRILMECSDYLTTEISRGRDVFKIIGEAMSAGDGEGLEEKMDSLRADPDKRAYDACASVNCFNQLLGAIYVDEFVGQETKDMLNTLADTLIDAYVPLFNDTAWLSDSGRAKALEKLSTMRKCILEPDGGYYSFEGLELVPTGEGGTLFDNYLRIKAYLRDQRNAIAGTPARAIFTWDALGPMTVNCFYDSETNSINIMPGFITSAISDHFGTLEGLMGSIGTVIAHEISHGFDFSGSQMDAYGLCEPLFNDADREVYLARVDKLAAYYDAIEITPTLHADGNLVKVEAAADLCGMQVTLLAARDMEKFDYTRFFETYASLYADSLPAGFAELMAPSDTHPLAHLRVNVNVQMFDEFYETYDVQEGDGMYLAPEARLRIFG